MHNEDYYQSVARNIFLNEQFLEILRAFSKEKIDVIPLKGIALLQNIYSDISQRYIGDIDLLVKPADVLKAAATLKSLGYVCPKANFNPRRPYSIYLNSMVFTSACEINGLAWRFTINPQACQRVNYSVHLHWHLLNTTLPFFMYKINMDDIWAHARIEKTKDGDLLMMSAHHLLIYLCLHAYHHSFERMGLFQDINQAVEFYKGELDWSWLADCACKWNVCMPFYVALYLTSKICQADIPQDLMRKLKPQKISRSGWMAISIILKNGKGWQNLAYALFLDMTENLLDKAKFVFLSLFPPPAEVCKVHTLASMISVFSHYLKRCGRGIKFLRDAFRANRETVP
jgi:hypothetical protein